MVTHEVNKEAECAKYRWHVTSTAYLSTISHTPQAVDVYVTVLQQQPINNKCEINQGTINTFYELRNAQKNILLTIMKKQANLLWWNVSSLCQLSEFLLFWLLTWLIHCGEFHEAWSMHPIFSQFMTYFHSINTPHFCYQIYENFTNRVMKSDTIWIKKILYRPHW
jgi:hypothetical protein